MSAVQLIAYLTSIIYVLIFFQVVRRAVASPRRVNVNIALFFALPATILGIVTAAAIGLVTPGDFTNALNGSLFLAFTFVLLRLVDDFAPVSRWLMRAGALLFLLFSLLLFVMPQPRPAWLALLAVAYVIGIHGYGAMMFVRESYRARGVTRRRLAMVAAGSFFLGLTMLLVVAGSLFQAMGDLSGLLVQLSALGSAVCYFLGFSPPTLLRRAWQEPELRTFLQRAARLPRLPTTEAIVEELERGAAAATGAPRAEIGLWDEASGELLFTQGEESFDLASNEETPEARAFQQGRASFSDVGIRGKRDDAGLGEGEEARAVLVAPIIAGEERLGVLRAYAPHASIFAEEDLSLVELLADQAAVILESRALIDEATRVRAREEVLRLKDDFLSAAAHDLRTPLTTLLGQVQLMKRQAERRSEDPAARRGLERIEREAQRLTTLVNELLDAQRVEQGQLLGEREQVNLAELARESCQRFTLDERRCHVEASRPVVGWYDRLRVTQLIDNLLENALKYSPGDSEVTVRVWQEGGEAHITVEDHGIGIPASDLPHLFGRYFRASNVDDRRFAGMGLGLYICRGVVEAHGGRIWATSQPGQGSTFHVVLPCSPPGQNGVPVESSLDRTAPPAAS